MTTCTLPSVLTRIPVYPEPVHEEASPHWLVLEKPVTQLPEGTCFVFGSNASGFHGAGSAGQACRGTTANTWRNDPWFQEALKTPREDPRRIGLWAVLGTARGFQTGREGVSYAIQTIEQPGSRRSTPRRTIYGQLVELVAFAHTHPSLCFLITPLGERYAGYSREEMSLVWQELDRRVGIPDTFHFIRLRSDTDPSFT